MANPTKLEISPCAKDKVSPAFYPLSSLHPSLIHKFKNEKFNDGVYQRVHRGTKADVYVYCFNKTIAASKVKKEDLEWDNTYDELADVQ